MNSITGFKAAALLILIFFTAGCCPGELKTDKQSYGEANIMAKKILIAYGTKSGSTAEVSNSIGKTLSENGFAVDVVPVKQITSIAGYDAVIIGSSIRTGKILSEVTDFVKQNKSELRKVPVAFLIVCMTLKDDTSENRKIADSYLNPVRAEITLIDTGLFAGKMDYSKLGFFARFAAEKMVKVPEGDFRNWKAIEKWGIDISNRMKKMSI